MCCCHNPVLFMQTNPRVLRYVVDPLGWNDISLQDPVRAVSGLKIKHRFHPARLKLVVCLETPSISHTVSSKHTRCLNQVVCHIGPFDPRPFRGIVHPRSILQGSCPGRFPQTARSVLTCSALGLNDSDRSNIRMTQWSNYTNLETYNKYYN